MTAGPAVQRALGAWGDRFPGIKYLKKIKHGKYFRNFFEIIKILILFSEFQDFGDEVFKKNLCAWILQNEKNRELKIKIFIFPKKIPKIFPCFIFLKFLFSGNRYATLQEHVVVAKGRCI